MRQCIGIGIAKWNFSGFGNLSPLHGLILNAELLRFSTPQCTEKEQYQQRNNHKHTKTPEYAPRFFIV